MQVLPTVDAATHTVTLRADLPAGLAGVAPGMFARLWLPLPDYAGFATRDTSPARASGLTLRPLAETARDTLLWARATGATATGLTADEESAALKVWHARRP